MKEQIPESWQAVLAAELEEPYWEKLEQFLEAERQEHTVYPPQEDVFNALEYTPFDDVKVFLLGQDPYHGEGQAHGLAFSVRPNVRVPPSLVNMYKELEADLGIERAKTGYLKPWAEQGVLLLNTVLTVRASEAASHKSQGWEKFTDSIIKAVNERDDPAVFVLWGGHAKKKLKLIDEDKHVVIQSAHPSPLSYRLFKDSKPYSKINTALEAIGKTPIDWRVT